jgi:hypothetical protein
VVHEFATFHDVKAVRDCASAVDKLKFDLRTMPKIVVLGVLMRLQVD